MELNSEILNSFIELKELYPRITEVLAREQFYRSNNLPRELNEMIEELCLDTDNLNGKYALSAKKEVNFDYLIKKEITHFFEFSSDFSKWKGCRSHQMEIVENITDIVSEQKINSDLNWNEDKKKYFKFRKNFFKELYRWKETNSILIETSELTKKIETKNSSKRPVFTSRVSTKKQKIESYQEKPNFNKIGKKENSYVREVVEIQESFTWLQGTSCLIALYLLLMGVVRIFITITKKFLEILNYYSGSSAQNQYIKFMF